MSTEAETLAGGTSAQVDEGPDGNSHSMASGSVIAELRANWRPLAACMLGICVSAVPPFTIGAFVDPVSAELGISVTQVLGWPLCWSLGIICAAPVVGRLADRHGAGRVAVVALLVLIAALVWTALAVRGSTGWYASGIAIGVAVAGAGGITFGRIVSGNFHHGLGTALGLMSTGIGVCALFGPRAMQAIIDAHGWRTAFLAQAGLVLLVLPIIVRWLRVPAPARGSGTPRADVGISPRTAIRMPVFWLLVVAVLMYGLCVAGVQTNLMVLLGSQGMGRAEAATALGLFGAASFASRLLTGIVIDKFGVHAAVLVALMMAMEGVSFVVLGYWGTSALIPVLLVFGIAVGAESDCLAYLVARFFGRRFFSSIFGMLGIVTLYIGTGLGPVLFSASHGWFGSYPPVLAIWGLLALFGAGAFLLTVRTPFFGSGQPAATRPSDPEAHQASGG